MIMKTIGSELGDYLYPIIAKHGKDLAIQFADDVSEEELKTALKKIEEYE